MKNGKLEKYSKYLIENSQMVNGFFPASPYPGNYNAYWPRDSVYIAEAVGGKRKKKYYKGFLKLMKKMEKKIDKIVYEKKRHEDHEYIDPKFMITGEKVVGKEDDLEEWGFVQHDAVSLNLYKIIEEEEKENFLSDREKKLVKKLADYVKNCWIYHPDDNSVWEEHKKIHSVSIGLMKKALEKVMEYYGTDEYEEEIKNMEKFVKKERVYNGYLVDFLWEKEYDGREGPKIDFNVLMFSYPLNAFSEYLTYDILKNTINVIEEKLVKEFGVKRYEEDVYKGGGEWLIGNQFLSLAYLDLFKRFKKEKYLIKAGEYLKKTEQSVTKRLELPEQIVDKNLGEKLVYLPLIKRYGVREQTPLLWSHAMYLINLKKMRLMIDE